MAGYGDGYGDSQDFADYVSGQVAQTQQQLSQIQSANLSGLTGSSAGQIAVYNGTNFVAGSLAGVSNRTSVSFLGTTITISVPQDIGTASDPTFRNLTLTSLTLAGGLKFLGYTSSAAGPTTTEYPNDKDAGVHKDTALGKYYFAFNASGTIKKVELT